jgi:uncharacterized protein (DUF697 family)
MKEKDTDKVDVLIGQVDTLGNVFESFDSEIKEMDGEQIVRFLDGMVNLGDKTWKIQADIIRHISKRSKYGDKAVETVAKKVSISRAYAFDLLKIAENIFEKDQTTRNLPGLGVGHYSIIVRNLSRIKAPIELLKKASDEGWSTVDLKKNIQGKKVEKKFKTVYYKMTEEKTPPTEWSSTKRISNKAYIMKDKNGTKFLEFKIFED